MGEFILKFFVLEFIILMIFHSAFSQNEIDVSLKNHSDREISTKAQLQRILKQYNLSKWTFSKKVVIDELDFPHSHPMLTLHTRFLENDFLLLSTYIHEQIHWTIEDKSPQTESAIEELKKIYPNAPPTPPEGDVNQATTYSHLIVGYLEYEAMKDLVGDEKAKEVMQIWSNRIYKWIYRTILNDEQKIKKILQKNDLLIINPLENNLQSNVKLIFTPKSEEFADATKEYQDIWNNEGEKIIEAMESFTKLRFSEKEIKIIVHGEGSTTGIGDQPTFLRASYPKEIKKSTLIHELGHRLTFQLKKKPIELIGPVEREHKTLFLFLYDLWVNLYGKEFANQAVEVEKKRKGKHNYELAWNWSLAFSETERASKWKELVKLNQ